MNVVDLLFLTGTLQPAACPNVARASRGAYSTVTSHLRGRPFESIQNCVDNHGLYIHSVEAFKEAIEMGYLTYQMSLHALIRNNCSPDVLEYCIYTRQVKILAGAVLEAMKNKDPRYLHILREATDPAVLSEAFQWIVEEDVPILQPLELLRVYK